MASFDEHEIRALTENIWSESLQLDATPWQHKPDAWDGLVFTGEASIHGAWDGTVVLHCHEHVARHAASSMWSCTLDEVTEDDLADTVAELTNMTAGGIKALLGDAHDLSIPAVTPGTGPADRGHDDSQTEVTRYAFRAAGHAVEIQIFTNTTNGAT